MATYSLGREQLLWIAAETTFATIPGTTSADSFVAADAVRVMEFDANAEIDRMVRDDKDNSRTAQDQIEKRTSGEWSAKGYLFGAGAASTAPDFDVIFANAFGLGAAANGSYQYTLVTDPTSSFAAIAGNATNHNHSKIALGCIVEELTIQGGGGDLVTWEAKGPCANVIDTGRCTLNTTSLSAGDTTATVTDGSGVQPGTILYVGTEQVYVSAVSGQTLTLTRGWGASTAASIASSSVFVPWEPTSQTLSSALPLAMTGSATIAGTNVTIKSWKFSLKNNRDYVNDHWGSTVADGYVNAKKREVTLELTARLERDNLIYIVGAGYHNEAHAVVITCGATSGNKYTLTVQGEMKSKPKITYPERDMVDVTLSYTGIYATDNGECSLSQV